MAEVGSAFVSILPSAKGFGRKLDSEVGGEVDSAGKRAGSRFGTALKAGAGLALAGAAFLGKFAADAIGEARDAQIVGARTESVIKSMGGAANLTAKQVGDLAGQISNKTAIDDEAIQSGQNLLLTFGNVRNEVGKGNDIFSQSSQLMADMSVAMGQSMKSSAVQLGKALNDPTKGVTALSRVGVSFTEQQKEQIKTMQESGDILGAQKVILGELEKQFGGAAASMATPAERAKVAWGNFQESVGTALLPTIDRLLTFFVNKAIPGVSRFAGIVGSVLGPVVARVGGYFTQAAGPVRSQFLPVLQTAWRTLTTQIIPAIQRVGQFLASTFGPVISRVVGIVRGQLVPAFTAVAQFIYGRLIPAVVRIVVAVGARLRPVFTAVARTMTGSVLPAVSSLLARFREWWPTIQRVIGVVLKLVGGLLKFGAAVLGKVLPPVIKFAGFLIGKLFGAIGAVIGIVVKIIGKILDFGAALVRGGAKVAEFATKVRDKIGDAIGFISDIPGKASDALGNLGSKLFSAGAALIQGLIDGITSKISAVTSKMSELAGKIKGFLPGSPVKTGPLTSWNRGGAGKRLAGLLVDGLDDSGPALRAASERMAASLRDPSVQLRTSLAGGGLTPTAAGVGVGLSQRDISAIAEAVRVGAYAGTSGRAEAQNMRRRAGGSR